MSREIATGEARISTRQRQYVFLLLDVLVVLIVLALAFGMEPGRGASGPGHAVGLDVQLPGDVVEQAPLDLLDAGLDRRDDRLGELLADLF